MRYASRVRYVQRAIRVYFGKQRLVVEDAGVVDSSSMIVHEQSITVMRVVTAAESSPSADHEAGSRCLQIRPDDGMRHHEGTQDSPRRRYVSPRN